MSAYFEDKAHIDALVTVALHGPTGVPIDPMHVWHGARWLHRDERTGDTFVKAVIDSDCDFPDEMGASRLGEMLWRENARSVDHRYADSHLLAEWETYSYEPGRRLSVPEALLALKGYEYQSCEHPDWTASEPFRFCQALRDALCSKVAGYDEADTWSIHDTHAQLVAS